MPGLRRLSRALEMHGSRVREKCILHAGKMFSALHAEMMFACGKNVFYIIDRTHAGSRCAARRQGHALRANGTASRPTATACGRHALRARTATPCGRIVPRNQDHGRLGGRGSGGKSCTAIKSRGWTCSGVRGPVSAHVSPAPAWLWSRSSGAGPCLCFCLCLCLCSCALALLWWQVQGSPRLRSRRGARA